MRGVMPTPKPTPSPATPAASDADTSTTSMDGSDASDTRDTHTPTPSKHTSARPSPSPPTTPSYHTTSGSRASSSYPFGGSSSRGSASGASFSFDPDSVGNDPGWTKAFPCQFYPPDADGCAEYRSCYDCLNGGIVYKGQGCYVNAMGRCLPLATAKFSKAQVDYRNVNASNNATKALRTASSKASSSTAAALYFPSRTATYCAMSDPACQRCRRTVFQDVIEYEATDGLSNYCVGHNSCVCIAVCEAPSRVDVLGGLMCNGKPQPGHSGSSNQASSQANSAGLYVNANVTYLLGVPMVGLVIAALVVSWGRNQRRRRDSHRRDQQQHRSLSMSDLDLPRDVSLFGDHRQFRHSESSSRDSSVSSTSTASSSVLPPSAVLDNGRALRLPGWRALRHELIEREQQLIAGRQDFSSIGYVQLLDTSPATSASPSATSDDNDDDGHELESDSDDHRQSSRRSDRAVDAQTRSMSMDSIEEDDFDDAASGDDNDDERSRTRRRTVVGDDALATERELSVL